METYTYRAATSSYVVFGIMCGVLALLGAWAAMTSPMSWGPVLIPVIAFALACLWLSRFRLVFSADALSYRSLFAGEHTIRYDSISSITSVFLAGRFSPPQRILVKTEDGAQMYINTKVFSREALSKLTALEGRKEPHSNVR